MDLYVDNTRLDILKSSFAINWKWYDVTKLLKRYTVASTNMNIPFSPINNKEFGFTNIAGSDLTPVWNEKTAQIYFGNYLALTGMLKTNKIGITSKGFQTNIRGDNMVIDALNANDPRAIFTSHATANLPATWVTMQLAADTLFDGATYGWLMPLVEDGTNLSISTGTTHSFYQVQNGLRQSELWLNVADWLTEAFSLASITLKVFDGGTVSAFASSAVYSVMREEYMPAYHIGLKRSGISTNVAWDATTARTFEAAAPQTIANADLLILGGKTTWEVIKIICQHYNLGIYIDQQLDEVTFFDLNTLPSASKDWTDKVISIDKFPVIKGYAKTNYVNYKPTDNLEETFGQITIDNNSSIDYIDDIRTLGSIDIGIPGLYDRYDSLGALKVSNVFKLDYFNNKDVYKYPVLFNRANQETVQNVRPIIQDGIGSLIATKNLYKMAFLDTTSYFDWIESKALDINEFYQCKIDINLADLVDLKPWDMITIKNLGTKMYVNQMKGFNLEKPSNIELIRLV